MIAISELNPVDLISMLALFLIFYIWGRMNGYKDGYSEGTRRGEKK